MGLPSGPSQLDARDPPSLSQLQREARTQGLATTPYWRTLLHYEDRVLGGPRSQVNTDWFFLSPHGRSDPAAELDATLAAFFDPAPRAPRDEAVRCIFGARFRWLVEQLRLDPAALPAADCSRREEWMRGLAPERVWVVFPSAYMNSPASMFGHTLLRLDGREVDQGTPLLAYAVNFAANTEERNGLVFAVRGLSGGYQGQFSVLPYYEKVKEYARMESRDLWEYPLALDPAQIEWLLLHLWELRGAEFTYYFFTRNCSYQLLTLLQAADPDLQWGNAYEWRAIPTDTLRTLAPLSAAPRYRPSLATELHAHSAQLDPSLRGLVSDLAAGRRRPDEAEFEALDPTTRSRVLSLANDLLYLRFMAGQIPRELSASRSHALLSARAATATRSGFIDPEPPSADPSRGHATQRLGIEMAWRNGRPLPRLRYRAAYHDLLDDPRGYTDGQQIEFLDLALGREFDAGRTDWALNLINIVSVAPADALFKPISWRVRAGSERAWFGRERASGILEGGPGMAWGAFDAFVTYGYWLSRLDVNADFAHGHTLGSGAALGLLARPAEGWQLQLELVATAPVSGADVRRVSLRLSQQWRLSRQLALRGDWDVDRLEQRHRQQFGLTMVRYF